MSRMEAQRRNARPFRFRHSQSLARRRHRLSQPIVLSTIQRLGSTTNLPTSDRLTISTLIWPQTRRKSLLKFRPLVAAIGVELQQKREQAKQRAHQQHTAVAVLHVRRVDDGVQQQALRIYQDVALLALDLLSGIVARRVNREPPFSALLTLWLSMIAAVGLASRPVNLGIARRARGGCDRASRRRPSGGNNRSPCCAAADPLAAQPTGSPCSGYTSPR